MNPEPVSCACCGDPAALAAHLHWNGGAALSPLCLACHAIVSHDPAVTVRTVPLSDVRSAA